MKTIEVRGVEKWREYVYQNGFVYRVDHPHTVHISETGSHRVVDGDGIAHYVGSSWIVIRWDGSVIA
jgi:hypothetical protein